MRSPPLVLLCGPAFSGKSTLARALSTGSGYAVVSFDAINASRGLSGGDGLPEAEWARTFALAQTEVEELLRWPSARVVVDDTLCYRFLRDGFRALAGRSGRECRLVVLRTSEQEIRRRLARNALTPERPGVAGAVLNPHLASFEWPGPDEPHRVVAGPLDLDALVDEGWLR